METLSLLFNVPLAALTAVFILIAVRRIGRFVLPLWLIMAGGALAVLLAGSISPREALAAVDFEVILFLFGVFVMGQALEESGYLSRLSFLLFRRALSPSGVLLLILFLIGFLSALIMNDTLAVIGTPVVLSLARRHDVPPKIFLLALCFAVTTGSVFSPVGNPQNLLIALHGGMQTPFVTFISGLFFPALFSLLAVFLVLKIFYRRELSNTRRVSDEEPPLLRDARLAALSKASLGLLVFLIGVKIFLPFIGRNENLPLPGIALTAALPVLLFSARRLQIVRNIDWHTLIFFAAMFVLMRSVWNTGLLQSWAGEIGGRGTVAGTLAVSVLISQVISNVPLVALYLPLAAGAEQHQTLMLALAAGSTIAGNLFILGAASNIIIIQNAEKRHGETLTFLEFSKAGLPITIIQAFIFWFFLR